MSRPIEWPEVDTSGRPSPPHDGLEGGWWPTLYEDLQLGRKKQWTRLAQEYEREPDSFFAAWHWLQHHPIFWYFGSRMPDRPARHEAVLCWDRGVHEGLEFTVVRVNEHTRRIEDDLPNGLVQVWVEVFPSSMRQASGDIRLHDTECDTGGNTYEEAVINAARTIYNRHGNDRQVLEKEWGGA